MNSFSAARLDLGERFDTWGRPILIAASVVAGIATLAFISWVERQSLTSWNVPLFALGVLSFIYVPGSSVLRLFGRSSSEAPVSHVLAIGLAAVFVLSYFALPLFPPKVILGLALLATAAWFSRNPLFVSRKKVPRLGVLCGAGLVAALAIGGLSQITYRGAQSAPDGGLSYMRSNVHANNKVGASDVLFHSGVVGALAQNPSLATNPYLSGESWSYHYGMDLVAALFARELGIHPLDLMSHLFPTLFVLVLCALVYHLARSLSLSQAASFLAAFLVFGADFGILMYLFPLREGWPQQYWLGFFAPYPGATLFWGNPQLPALCVMMSALLVLGKHHDTRRSRILGGLLLGSTVFFKVFLALHVAGVLVVATVVAQVFARDRKWLEVCGVAGTVMFLFALANQFFGGSATVTRLVYLQPVIDSLRAAGLDPLVDTLQSARIAPAVATIVPAVAVVGFYLLMMLGIRVAVLPAAFRSLASYSEDRVRFFLAGFFLLGLVPTQLLVIQASGLNNSFWFTNQSLFAGSILVADRIHALSSRRLRLSVASLALALSLSPTLKSVFFWRGLETGHVSAGEVEASLFLRSAARPTDVAIHQLFSKKPSPASHLAGVQTVLTHWQGFPLSFSEPAVIEKRMAQIFRFFETEDPVEAHAILESHDVSWVFNLKARSPLRFPPEPLLEEVYENGDVVLYRVTGASESALSREAFEGSLR